MSDYQYNSYLNQALEAIDDGVGAGLMETSIMVATQAKNLAPVKSGELKGSIMWKNAKGGDGMNTEGKKLSQVPSDGNYHVGTAVEHGIYQEFGTRKMEPNSFLRPAGEIVMNSTDKDIAMKKTQDEYAARFLKKV